MAGSHILASTLDLDSLGVATFAQSEENRKQAEAASQAASEAMDEALKAYQKAEEAEGKEGPPGADGQDGITVVIHSESGNVFKNGQIATVLTARVYQGEGEIDADGATFIYLWTKVSDDGTPDEEWNLRHQAASKQITVTKDDVWRRGTFTCEITPVNP